MDLLSASGSGAASAGAADGRIVAAAALIDRRGRNRRGVAGVDDLDFCSAGWFGDNRSHCDLGGDIISVPLPDGVPHIFQPHLIQLRVPRLDDQQAALPFGMILEDGLELSLTHPVQTPGRRIEVMFAESALLGQAGGVHLVPDIQVSRAIPADERLGPGLIPLEHQVVLFVGLGVREATVTGGTCAAAAPTELRATGAIATRGIGRLGRTDAGLNCQAEDNGEQTSCRKLHDD